LGGDLEPRQEAVEVVFVEGAVAAFVAAAVGALEIASPSGEHGGIGVDDQYMPVTASGARKAPATLSLLQHSGQSGGAQERSRLSADVWRPGGRHVLTTLNESKRSTRSSGPTCSALLFTKEPIRHAPRESRESGPFPPSGSRNQRLAVAVRIE
jgi:hypothetical protein